jgi:hypothetical protein
MIIKSMSRKQATFSQLVDYMEDGRQDKKFTLKNNLFSNSSYKIKEEFERNASFFKKRKDSVYMYHEVISITKSKQLTNEQQKEILRKIVLEYIQKRAKNNLVYGVLHDDKTDNFHYHLLISSNELEETKKHRLSKYEFDKIKKDLEVMVLSKYPELQQGVVINKPSSEKLSNKGAEVKRRTGKTSQRDSVKNRLETVFLSSKDKQSFFENIEKENLEIYVRGKTVGVVDKETGRKHRLKTLGMLEVFNEISNIVEKSNAIDNEQEFRKEELQENRKPYKEKVSIKNNAYTAEKKQSSENNKPKAEKQESKVTLSKEEIEINKRREEVKKSRDDSIIQEYSKTKNR